MQTCTRSIVMVSDDFQLRNALQEIFHEIGWHTREARAVSELPQLLAQGTPALILSDETLPDGAWCDVLEIARAVCSPARVVVTARGADEQLGARVFNLGGFDVLAQPLDRLEVIGIANSAWLHLSSRTQRAAC